LRGSSTTLYDGSPRPTHHSEQFVYWACKEADGVPCVQGTFVETALEVLTKQGACLAETWPHQPLLIGPTEGQGPPPQGAEEEAAQYRLKGGAMVSAGEVDGMRALLDDGHPVVLTVLTFDSWDYPSVADTGDVQMPLPDTQDDGAHAVCLVGYELRPEHPGGGAFIFRNSWGTGWAPQSRFRRGYGTLPFAYVRLYGEEALA